MTVETKAQPPVRLVDKRQHADEIRVETTPDGRELAIIPVSTPSVFRDLRLIRAPGLGVKASADGLFAGGQFNRDGKKVGQDFLPYHPEIAEETIVAAVTFQGRVNNSTNEEQPGKYHHEHRSKAIIARLMQQGAAEHIIDRSLAIMQELGENGGGVLIKAVSPIMVLLIPHHL